MSSTALVSRRRRRLVAGPLWATSAVSALFLAGCSSGDDEGGEETPSAEASSLDPGDTLDPGDLGDTPLPAEPTSDDVKLDEEQAGGSGPDGTYVVSDTYTDVDFDFTYEGLVKVPLDSLGAYSDGECYYAIGTARFREDSPSAAITTSDAFRPSFAPIIAGSVDEEQDDEFFNCDAAVIGGAGYTQSSTTNVALGESAPVWLDAIHLAPDQVDALDGFRLYGEDDLVFSAEVTQDLTG